MPSYPYLSLLTTTGFVLELALAAFILWKGKERNWPSILALCLTDLIADVALSHFNHRSSSYFYAYYISYYLDAFLRLWVLHDVLRSFPGPAFTQQFLHWVTAAGGVVMAAGCWSMAAVISGQLPSRIRMAAIYFDRCVSIAWAGFIIAGVLAIAGSRLAWNRAGGLIAFGLLLRIASGMAIAGLLMDNGRSHLAVATYLRASTAVFVLIAWFVAVMQRPKTYTPVREPALSLNSEYTPRPAH